MGLDDDKDDGDDDATILGMLYGEKVGKDVVLEKMDRTGGLFEPVLLMAKLENLIPLEKTSVEVASPTPTSTVSLISIVCSPIKIYSFSSFGL